MGGASTIHTYIHYECVSCLTLTRIIIKCHNNKVYNYDNCYSVFQTFRQSWFLRFAQPIHITSFFQEQYAYRKTKSIHI